MNTLLIKNMTDIYATQGDLDFYNNIMNTNYHLEFGDLLRTRIDVSYNGKNESVFISSAKIDRKIYCPNLSEKEFNAVIEDVLTFVKTNSNHKDLVTFVDDVQKEHHNLLSQMKSCNFQSGSYKILNGDQIYFNLYSYVTPSDIEDVDFIESNHDTVNSSSSLWDIAVDIVCIDAKEKSLQYNKDALQKYYEENIQGKEKSEINIEDFNFYSDWHKDIYGYRPHFDSEIEEDLDLD